MAWKKEFAKYFINRFNGDLGCKNTPVKAECSNKAMFVDSHTETSKNERIFFRDARFMKKFKAGEFVEEEQLYLMFLVWFV